MPVALLQLSTDLWVNNIFPLLTLTDLISLADAVPAFEPLLDSWRPWGELYRVKKRLAEAPTLTFRQFYSKLQSLYIWGFIRRGGGFKWLLDKPPGNSGSYDRGVLHFHIPSLQGVLQSPHGIDIVKPLLLEYQESYVISRIGHGVFLCDDGQVLIKHSGNGLSQDPVLRHCSPEGFYRSQWATHITEPSGRVWNFLAVDDKSDKHNVYFTFPFMNRPISIIPQRHCVWCLVEDMGIVQISPDYEGGPDYKILCKDVIEDTTDSNELVFPEKMISMIGFYRRSLAHNPGEAHVEYDQTAVLLGESGRIYYFGPAKYSNSNRTGMISPNEWHHLYPEIEWNSEMCLFEIQTELQQPLQDAQKSKYPRIKSLYPWAYQYGLAIYPDDSTVMYLDVNHPPEDPEITHKFTIETFGINGLGYDGRVYRLPLNMGEWHQIPKAYNVVDLQSFPVHYQGVLLDSTMTILRTSEGNVSQLGLVVGAVALQQTMHREVPPSYMPTVPRLSQELSGAGINPRLREFINPFAAVPKPIKLSGRVMDVLNISKEGMTCCAIVKDDHI